MPNTTLVPLLADGEFHSGQALADALGVSRTAIWKQLNRLQSLGLQVESVKVAATASRAASSCWTSARCGPG